MTYWFAMTVFALVCWGITGVTQKLSTNHISSRLSFVWFAVAFVPIAILVGFAVADSLRVSGNVLLFAALGGALNGLGALTSFVALERGGKASIVIPLVALYPLVTVIGALLFLGERLTSLQVIGVFCAVVAGILLSKE